MKAVYGQGASAYMTRQLRDWLELSLHRGLPSSLLLLSRAFTITTQQVKEAKEPAEKRAQTYESLKDTLSTLPVVEDVTRRVLAESRGDTGVEAMARRLEELKKEEELIKEEAEAAEAAKKEAEAVAAAAAAAKAAAAPAVAAATAEAATAIPAAPVPAATAAAPPPPLSAATADVVAPIAAAVAKEAAAAVAAAVAPAAPVVPPDAAVGVSEEERAARAAAERAKKMRDIVEALAALASDSAVSRERALFLNLVKKEISRIGEAGGTEGSSALLFTGKGLEVLHPEDAAPAAAAAKEVLPQRLSDRVSKILHRIEKELDEVDGKIGGKLKMIDVDGDGLISRCVFFIILHGHVTGVAGVARPAPLQTGLRPVLRALCHATLFLSLLVCRCLFCRRLLVRCLFLHTRTRESSMFQSVAEGLTLPFPPLLARSGGRTTNAQVGAGDGYRVFARADGRSGGEGAAAAAAAGGRQAAAKGAAAAADGLGGGGKRQRRRRRGRRRRGAASSSCTTDGGSSSSVRRPDSGRRRRCCSLGVTRRRCCWRQQRHEALGGGAFVVCSSNGRRSRYQRTARRGRPDTHQVVTEVYRTGSAVYGRFGGFQCSWVKLQE